jgi:molecular chaperone DnaJ
MNQDPYFLLGVPPEASDEDLKRAYRQKAREFHPDITGGDAATEERFNDVRLAYELLRNPESRARFEGTAGGRRRIRQIPGTDFPMALELEFREAVFGTRREVTVETPARCERCSGRGTQPGLSGDPCPDCGGDGRRVVERTLTVDVPAGVDNGSTLRLEGYGTAGFRGGASGALLVHLSVSPDDVFEHHGDDLHANLSIAMTQASLGATVDFETLDEPRELSIAPGTQTGKVIRMKGLGVPRRLGRGRGDLCINVVVETPTELSTAQRKLLEQLAAERAEAVDPPGHDRLFSKIRSALR